MLQEKPAVNSAVPESSADLEEAEQRDQTKDDVHGRQELGEESAEDENRSDGSSGYSPDGEELTEVSMKVRKRKPSHSKSGKNGQTSQSESELEDKIKAAKEKSLFSSPPTISTTDQRTEALNTEDYYAGSSTVDSLSSSPPKGRTIVAGKKTLQTSPTENTPENPTEQVSESDGKTSKADEKPGERHLVEDKVETTLSQPEQTGSDAFVPEGTEELETGIGES